MSERGQLNWYAAYTRANQELAVKSRLSDLGVECYLPMREEIKEMPAGKQKVRVLLIRGLIFIHTDKATSFALLNDYGLNLFYLQDRERKSSLIIPDKQMRDFIFLLAFSSESVEILNKDLKRGDLVRVTQGPLAGLEGELIRIKGHKRVVVRLNGVVSIATSYIPSAFLEKIG